MSTENPTAREAALRCAEIAANVFGGRSHKVSENADTYRIQDHAIDRCVAAIRAYAATLPQQEERERVPGLDMAKALLRAHSESTYGRLIKTDDYFEQINVAIDMLDASTGGSHG